MWIPASEQELLKALTRADLVETESFDGKRELPAPGKSASLAVDVAAMSTEGGVIIYGIAEDQKRRLTQASPIALAGARERVDQIVQTLIREPPFIKLHEIPSTTQPSTGFLLIEAPASPRAPHMVIAKGEHRYYGRGATGNRLLTEGEVALYYERRRRLEVDRDELLANFISSASAAPPEAHLAYMYAFARPTAADRRLLERDDEPEILHAAQTAAQAAVRSNWVPDIAGSAWQRAGADAWSIGTSEFASDPSETIEITVDTTGSAWLFSGRAGQQLGDPPVMTVFEQAVSGNLVQLLALVDTIYRRTDYHGSVDIGIAVTNLHGAVGSVSRRNVMFDRRYNADDYRRTDRVLAGELGERREAIRDALVGRFLIAI